MPLIYDDDGNLVLVASDGARMGSDLRADAPATPEAADDNLSPHPPSREAISKKPVCSVAAATLWQRNTGESWRLQIFFSFACFSTRACF